MTTKETSPKPGSNPVTYLFRMLWRYSDGNRRNVVIYWCMFVAANTLDYLAIPFLMAMVMDKVAEGVTAATLSAIVILLILKPLAEIGFWAFHGPARVIERLNAFKAKANYRAHLLKGVMKFPMAWHTDRQSGDTIDRIEKGTQGLNNFAESSFEVISLTIRLIVSVCVLAYFSLVSAAIAAIMIAISTWITLRFDRVLIVQYKKLNHQENRISASVFDAISNITTVIILRVEKLIFEAIVRKICQPYSLFKKNAVINELKWFLINMVSTAMAVAILIIYIRQNVHSSEGVLVGNVFLLIRYVEQIGEVFYHFTRIYGDLVQYQSKVMNAEELAEQFKPGNLTNHKLPVNWQTIEVRDLSFSYHNETAEPHLSRIAFSLARGEHVAFVGESGSGKTTLLKIMRGLYQPLELRLMVDGKRLSDGFDGICRDITLVPQNPELFTTTILENITLGADYDPAKVRQYTDMACITDVIDKLPRAFESSVNEKGVNLSGGQQQRLALARGLLACEGKSIVLLDEPTSSVDPANEIRIHQNIFKAFKDKAIISSVHRLYLLPLFDRIVMLKEGKILATGTLEHLLAICPEFKELWEQCSEQDNSTN